MIVTQFFLLIIKFTDFYYFDIWSPFKRNLIIINLHMYIFLGILGKTDQQVQLYVNG